MHTKVTVEKTPKRAGATPLLGGPSAQNVVGSLPPVPSRSGACCGPRVGVGGCKG